MIRRIDGGVTAPKGYKATGGAAGIKAGKNDLAIFTCPTGAVVAGAFTTNVVMAASVKRNKDLVTNRPKVYGVVINSGNANACTGLLGERANEEMAKCLGDVLGVSADGILTASTGVIGVEFPIEKVKQGIAALVPSLGEDRAHSKLAAESIMTTDTYSKEIAVVITLGGKEVTIGGMAKGSGMIHPNMATMLGFVTTDANISQGLLEKALQESVPLSYNMVSVDGDTSTNDTILVLANGLAENPEINECNAEYQLFAKALHEVNVFLAKELVRDGEGATKLIEVSVRGGKSEEEVKKIAKSVITSNLVKTAMFGADANWGRVLCAMGYSGAAFDPMGIDMDFVSAKGRITLMKQGTPVAFDEDVALAILQENEILVDITMAEGSATATAWGCDLSYDYVKINGDYRS